MAKQETNIFKLSLVALSKLGTRMFRINTGRAWTGNKITKLPANHGLYPGAIIIHDPRPFSTGTPKGYSDGTGWTPVVITQQMVGEQIAVFTAGEAKAPNGRATSEQINFIDQVIKAGGIAGVFRSPEEAVQIVQDFKNKHGVE
jgi:hypothetical protein